MYTTLWGEFGEKTKHVTSTLEMLKVAFRTDFSRERYNIFVVWNIEACIEYRRLPACEFCVSSDVCWWVNLLRVHALFFGRNIH